MENTNEIDPSDKTQYEESLREKERVSLTI